MPLQAYHQAVTSILFFLLAASISMLNARGETHIVGDGDGWDSFTDSSNWANGKKFHVGDLLVFNYERSSHNVMQVNSTAYEDCLKDANIGLFTSGKDSLVLSEVGQNWYICGVSDHCESGQKLTVTVVR